MEESNRMIIYTDGSGFTKIDVKLEEETLWLTQAQMRELYQTSKSNVSEHIKHIFEEGGLQEDSVVRKFRTTAADGKAYLTTFYNLDMIIALAIVCDPSLPRASGNGRRSGLRMTQKASVSSVCSVGEIKHLRQPPPYNIIM